MTYDREVAPGIYDEVPSAVDKHVKYKLIKETLLLAAPRHKVGVNIISQIQSSVPLIATYYYDYAFFLDFYLNMF